MADPIKDKKPPKQNYSPLEGVVEVKPYSTPPTGYSREEILIDLPEPSIVPPVADRKEAPGSDTKTTSAEEKKSSAKSKEEKPFNPGLNDLTDSQKEKSAKQMAEYLLQLYATGKLKANDLVKISERRINKLANSGEVDMSLMVQVGEDQQMTLGEFFKFYNDQCDGNFKMTEEFYNAVLPPLTRVLAKRGHGMTDEQYLIFMFGQDIFLMIAEGMATRNVLKDMINFAKEHSAGKKTTTPTPPPATEMKVVHKQDQAPSPPPQVIISTPGTLQEEVLSNVKFRAKENTGEGIAGYGDKTKLRKLEKFSAEGDAAMERADKNAKRIINSAKKKSSAPLAGIPTGKKGPGRPRGSKNKPKLK